MNFDEYQQLASRTANHDIKGILTRLESNPELLELANYALGAAGEAGEIADIVKKVIFQGHEFTEEVMNEILKECGDELWYIANATRVLKKKLSQIAEMNINKLKKRYPDGFSAERSVNRDE